MKTLVLQSYRQQGIPPWIQACLASVKQWSAEQGHDYRLLGDEIFDLVPDWYLHKVKEKLPVATDYARLLLIREALSEQAYDQAIWFDADMLIFEPSLVIEFTGSCAFGQELWVQEKAEGGFRSRKNVHNAVCVFSRGCPVLPFLIQTVHSIIRRVDADKIAPQLVGPKLLTALHNIAGFSLLPEIGALSPAVLRNIVKGEGEALSLQRRQSPRAMKAANLCASLVDAETANAAVSTLLARRQL